MSREGKVVTGMVCAACGGWVDARRWADHVQRHLYGIADPAILRRAADLVEQSYSDGFKPDHDDYLRWLADQIEAEVGR